MLAIIRSARALGELPALLRCVATQADALVAAATAAAPRPLSSPLGPVRAADPLPSMLGFHSLLPETAQAIAQLSHAPVIPATDWPSPATDMTLPDFGSPLTEIGGQFSFIITH